MKERKPASNVFFALVELARMRIVNMVLVSCATGYILAYSGQFQLGRLLWTLVGTGLLSAGSCALNCYVEREQDALMPRTSQRPIPAGIISPTGALAYGLGLVSLGCVLLFWQVNMLAALLGLTAAFVYLALYTPAKRLTWMNTSIGALPGAIPPLIGWAAARGQLDFGAWVLFAMLFIWQHTHFLPIAWLYKSDYEAAGFRMLPVLETTGKKTFLLTVITAIILLPVSLLLCRSNLTGYAYCFAAIIGGALLIASSLRLSIKPSRAGAQAVLLLSLIYLPMIFAAVVLDRYGAQLGICVQAWLGTVWPWI
jgi:protoheme IX farnesyltransferase